MDYAGTKFDGEGWSNLAGVDLAGWICASSMARVGLASSLSDWTSGMDLAVAHLLEASDAEIGGRNGELNNNELLKCGSIYACNRCT